MGLQQKRGGGIFPSLLALSISSVPDDKQIVHDLLQRAFLRFGYWFFANLGNQMTFRFLSSSCGCASTRKKKFFFIRYHRTL